MQYVIIENYKGNMYTYGPYKTYTHAAKAISDQGETEAQYEIRFLYTDYFFKLRRTTGGASDPYQRLVPRTNNSPT
jgi:hypothetical protein